MSNRGYVQGGARCPHRALRRAQVFEPDGDTGLHHAAFSLIEVVAAIGVFAIGMVAVLGLFTPVTKSVSHVSEAEAAARIADAVRARLQALPFETALALIHDATTVTGNARDNGTAIFATRGGEVALYDASTKTWNTIDYSRSPPAPVPLSEAERFFEIDLIRDESLSPQAADPTAPMVAFSIRVRWPAALDHGGMQVLFFTGTIAR